MSNGMTRVPRTRTSPRRRERPPRSPLQTRSRFQRQRSRRRRRSLPLLLPLPLPLPLPSPWHLHPRTIRSRPRRSAPNWRPRTCRAVGTRAHLVVEPGAVVQPAGKAKEPSKANETSARNAQRIAFSSLLTAADRAFMEGRKSDAVHLYHDAACEDPPRDTPFPAVMIHAGDLPGAVAALRGGFRRSRRDPRRRRYPPAERGMASELASPSRRRSRAGGTAGSFWKAARRAVFHPRWGGSPR